MALFSTPDSNFPEQSEQPRTLEWYHHANMASLQPQVFATYEVPKYYGPLLLLLLTAMTGISLHMQWPLTSQLHSSFLKENNCFVVFFSFRIKLHALICSWTVVSSQCLAFGRL
jgi:hypothetical protein